MSERDLSAELAVLSLAAWAAAREFNTSCCVHCETFPIAKIDTLHLRELKIGNIQGYCDSSDKILVYCCGSNWVSGKLEVIFRTAYRMSTLPNAG